MAEFLNGIQISKDNKIIEINNIGKYDTSLISNHNADETVVGGEIFNDYNENKAGKYAHAEGKQTEASGEASHAEGISTHAVGVGSHAEGRGSWEKGEETIQSNGALGAYSHVEGYGSSTGEKAQAAHAEGYSTANGEYSHSEGYETTASGKYSHVEGNGNSTGENAEAAHAEGYKTKAEGYISHAEGYGTTSFGNYSHAEGITTKAIGIGSHVEGYNAQANKNYSHAEGYSTADGEYSHAEGWSTTSGNYSHAEGMQYTTEGVVKKVVASGEASHAEGTGTLAQGHHSHAQNCCTEALGDDSHAEGVSSKAQGRGAHAEGNETMANGSFSHAGGSKSIANGTYSFVHGEQVIANAGNQFVIGKYNEDNEKAWFIIGNGTDESNRNNLFSVAANGVRFNNKLISGHNYSSKTTGNGPIISGEQRIYQYEEYISPNTYRNSPICSKEYSVNLSKSLLNFSAEDFQEISSNYGNYKSEEILSISLPKGFKKILSVKGWIMSNYVNFEAKYENEKIKYKRKEGNSDSVFSLYGPIPYYDKDGNKLEIKGSYTGETLDIYLNIKGDWSIYNSNNKNRPEDTQSTDVWVEQWQEWDVNFEIEYI